MLSDSREATKAVFPPRVVETLNENIDLVRIIHVTDQSPRVKLCAAPLPPPSLPAWC